MKISRKLCLALGICVCVEAIECASSNKAYGMIEIDDVNKEVVKKQNPKPEDKKPGFRNRIKNLPKESLENNSTEISETTIERQDKFWRNAAGDLNLVETN